MGDMTDEALKAWMSSPTGYTYFLQQATSAHNVYWGWNIVLVLLSIATSTTISVVLSSDNLKRLTNDGVWPYVLAGVAWVSTVTALVMTAFSVKENKEKWERIHDQLIVESAFHVALSGPYALDPTPNRLFVARIGQIYLGSNPSTPPAPPARVEAQVKKEGPQEKGTPTPKTEVQKK
jgi:hypothetical protein